MMKNFVFRLKTSIRTLGKIPIENKPVYKILKNYFYLILFLLLSNRIMADATLENDGELWIGAVQFAVSESVYRSTESFENAINSSLNAVEKEAAGNRLDMVVFPEYTSAFLGLSLLSEQDLQSIRDNLSDEYQLVRNVIHATEKTVISIWQRISRERDYAILAGSILVVEKIENKHESIFNRALLFSRDGTLIWHQDKVFLGEPEKRILNLHSSSLNKAHTFQIDQHTIALTICRDTYHKVWEEHFSHVDLWIDIKANEIPFTRSYYDEALLARLKGSRVPYGITVSLSGEIMGFQFTGPTEFLSKQGSLAGSNPWTKNQALVFAYPRRGL